MENLEQIKKAVEIEVKYKYININGKSRSFASFICSELRKEIKVSKNPKWKVVDGYGGGIVLWNGKQKEPEKNSKAQYYLKDGRLLQHESTWIFER